MDSSSDQEINLEKSDKSFISINLGASDDSEVINYIPPEINTSLRRRSLDLERELKLLQVNLFADDDVKVKSCENLSFFEKYQVCDNEKDVGNKENEEEEVLVPHLSNFDEVQLAQDQEKKIKTQFGHFGHLGKFVDRRATYAFEQDPVDFSEKSVLRQRQTQSQDTKLNVAELESRIHRLVSAFSERTRKAKEKIIQPPTPSSGESDKDDSDCENLRDRMNSLTLSQTGFDSSRVTTPDSQSDRKFQIKWRKFRRRAVRCTQYLIDPQSLRYIFWLVIISFAFVYNALVIPLRMIFPYQSESNLLFWHCCDTIADVLYLIDILLVKCRMMFVTFEGFLNKDVSLSRERYIYSKIFKIDLASLLPVDIILWTFFNISSPWLRIPRILKMQVFSELFESLDKILASPFIARLAKTIAYMLFMIHLNACAYYGLSYWEGIGATEWTYNGEGNAYIRCFYFATKTVTSIGKNPKPENEIEYMFMTFAWLSGVFVFALLIGQIRDIIATATKVQTEYRQLVYGTIGYLHRMEIPKELQDRVKLWLSYTFEQQKTLDENQILSLLPQKMRTDIALHVHIETLNKVKLFKNCEIAFFRDLVHKLKSIIFLPGDFVCKKGEVGKEMYIIKTGKVLVLGGSSDAQVLAELSEGSVFGELALLGTGIGRRTANVRSAGFSNLFILSKNDLNEVIKDYPQAQDIIRRKTKRFMKKIEKKEKESKNAEAEKGEDLVIIQNPKSTKSTKMIDTVLKLMDPNSMVSRYLRQGSRAKSQSLSAPSTISSISISSMVSEVSSNSAPLATSPGLKGWAKLSRKFRKSQDPLISKAKSTEQLSSSGSEVISLTLKAPSHSRSTTSLGSILNFSNSELPKTPKKKLSLKGKGSKTWKSIAKKVLKNPTSSESKDTSNSKDKVEKNEEIERPLTPKVTIQVRGNVKIDDESELKTEELPGASTDFNKKLDKLPILELKEIEIENAPEVDSTKLKAKNIQDREIITKFDEQMFLQEYGLAYPNSHKK